MYYVEYALKLMKDAWKRGVALKTTADVANFVEWHVHDEFVLSVGPKRLLMHKHLATAQPSMIVHKPPHRVHKALKLHCGCGGDRKGGGGGGDGSISYTVSIKSRRKVKKDDIIQHHPYKYAAEIAQS